MQRSLREKEAAMKILLLELSGKGSEEKRKGLAMIAENERAEEERLQNGMKGHERERTAEINALRDDVTVLEEVRKCRQSRCQTECNENQHQQTSDKDTPDAVIPGHERRTVEQFVANPAEYGRAWPDKNRRRLLRRGGRAPEDRS
ncbi:hypothetical protein BLNAU_823 [Blattamonas nauphoetae]|uniref:Uncharacterized protein n=1 Tax=Blattamonas nauphoetae TaxID=2049346 RepID=A0ABQ9YKK7_9EUKA|nr:hypothetical protein BLNAU_823 [Blattamonas nauphoetae]